MSKTKAQKTAEAENEVDGQEFDRDGNPLYKVTDEGTQVQRDEEGDPIPVDATGTEPTAETPTDADGDYVSADTHICLDGAYLKHDHAADPRPYRVSHGGGNYEHTHEDAQGVWCYRRM